MSIRVTLFEDNKSLRQSLYQMINGSEGFVCAGAFENCLELFKNIEETQPDVVLMDIEMPGINGIEAVKMLREKYPQLKILMQTISEDSDRIFQSIVAGASGYILKTNYPARFLDFIKETYAGGAPMSPSVATKVLQLLVERSPSTKEISLHLSEKEKEILSCLVNGMSYKLIGDACFISIDTVRGHIRHIYDKLHVQSKREAITKSIKNKII
jgi:DNA-binding NarL/FixJ family response regulator